MTIPIIRIRRGDTLQLRPYPFGDISARTKLWFTLKTSRWDTDSESMIQVEETAGLEYINGAVAAVPGNGSITVINAGSGDIQVDVAAVETAKLQSCTGIWYYDIQMLDGASVVTTMQSGECYMLPDVTKVIA